MPCNLCLEISDQHHLIIFPSYKQEKKYFKKQQKKKEKEENEKKEENLDADASTSSVLHHTSSSSSSESEKEGSPKSKRSKKPFNGYAILAHTKPFHTGVSIESKFRINDKSQWMCLAYEAQKYLRTKLPKDFFQNSPQNGYEVSFRKK